MSKSLAAKRAVMRWKRNTIDTTDGLLKPQKRWEDIINAIVEQPLIVDRNDPIVSHRDEKVFVYMKAVFTKVGEINTTKENFYVEVFLQAKWREPRLDGQTNIIKSSIKWEEYWNPKIHIDNGVGEIKETIWPTVMFNANGEALICERRKVKGCYSETMELQEFPFDTQDLNMTVVSERNCNEIGFLNDIEHSLISQNSFVQNQEWLVYNYVDVQFGEVKKVYENSGQVLHPTVTFVVRTQRRFQFYVYNFILVLFFINTMTFTTFAVSHEKPENRLQLTFILLLTTVGFRTNVNNVLPKISYLTKMDKIILTSFVIQCIICIWHSIVVLIKKSPPASLAAATATVLLNEVSNATIMATPVTDSGLDTVWIDRYVFLASFLVYIVIHLIFGLLIYLQTTQKSNEFSQKEIEMKQLEAISAAENSPPTD
ncbi:hypothetical protein HELRODRAFT_191571 [Helobdella robusta]|uniref:Neurotransmitter-gated ion-channel ligand-binding domain-containing protein n=1 Tax=Helobdella robusta TaxID=6412 RepID=T1FT33_HELRO|nr:hypothetical protein HELRODRAFT_191571 [Helobdella robusta]ESO05047.1 hypothetical protein HELRODRAFT_191571 [Helobdella robusta]